MPELSTDIPVMPERPHDPVEPPPFQPQPQEPDRWAAVDGFPPLSPARQWLFEHRRLDMKPYTHFRPVGDVVFYPKDDLVSMYPGVADKIIKSREAGYSDAQIMLNIIRKVDQSLQADYSDSQIEQNLYYGYKDYGFWDKPLGSLFYGRPENLIEKVWDYVGTTPDYDKHPVRHEIRAVVERGLSSFTMGVSDAFQEEIATPKSIPGTLGGSVASLIGFISGPLKMSRYLIGGRLAPTATGLRGVAQIATEGSATMALAGTLSSAIPAFQENEDLSEAAADIAESTVTMGLIGSLYPMAGAIESKPLRLAVGLAVMDKIRAGTGQWFTVDDVVAGVADGTIDQNELADRSFGYLMDMYFLSKVPTMRKQLEGLEQNAIIRKMMQVRAEEAEKIIVELGKAGLIPPSDPKFLDGIGRFDKRRAFGTEQNFDKAYKMLHTEQSKLAQHIRKAILDKTTVRIPKELEPLAQKALTFRTAKTFAAGASLKLKDSEKGPLQKTVKGDLTAFWSAFKEGKPRKNTH